MVLNKILRSLGNKKQYSLQHIKSKNIKTNDVKIMEGSWKKYCYMDIVLKIKITNRKKVIQNLKNSLTINI